MLGHINENHVLTDKQDEFRWHFRPQNSAKKVRHTRIGMYTLKLIESYLKNRKQCTKANNITSKLHPITCGVPEGSVLGPLLFLL